MNRLLYYFLVSIILTAIAMSFGFIYLIINPPIKFKLNTPLKVIDKTVEQGGNVNLILDYCKYTSETPFTYFVLVDHTLLPAIPAVLVLEEGCHTSKYSLNIAYSVPVGTYRVSMVKNYPIFIFKGVDLVFFSNEFEVVKANIK